MTAVYMEFLYRLQRPDLEDTSWKEKNQQAMKHRGHRQQRNAGYLVAYCQKC
jgi:hypothetical protein